MEIEQKVDDKVEAFSFTNTSFPYFTEKHPNQSQTYGLEETMLNNLYEDVHANKRSELLYYPFTSHSKWEFASFLLRLGLSMAKIDQLLKSEAVSNLPYPNF